MPEGFQPIDSEAAIQLATIATDLKLPNGAMQELVTKVSPLLPQEKDARRASACGQLEREETVAELGDHPGETVQLARAALKRFGTPELRKLFDPLDAGGTGFGHNIELLRLLARVGRELW